jgi:iron complex transport system substrate-binding protein
MTLATISSPHRGPRSSERGRSAGLVLAAILALALVPSCVDRAQAQTTQNRSTQDRTTPDRIVAAGGVITEILYALGAGDRIAGVDATSLHPPEALKEKPNVGYVRALSAEGVLSLKPSQIIAIDSAGPPDVVRLLREAGVPIATIPEDYSETGVIARIRAVGAAAGLAAKAEGLAAATSAQFAALATLRQAVDRPRRILFVLALRDGRPMVGGRNSGADAIIRLAGGINAAGAVEGYKPMSDEAVITAAPDVVLMMDRGAHAVGADDLFRLASFSATPAAARRALVVMDGLYLLGFGPRTPAAARDLMAAAYPERGFPRLTEVRP